MDSLSMTDDRAEIAAFLAARQPYDSLSEEGRRAVAMRMRVVSLVAGEPVYALGDRLQGLYLIRAGRVDVSDSRGEAVSVLGPGNSFGERGLARDGVAVTSARAVEATDLLLLPADEFRRLRAEEPEFARFFDRTRPDGPRPSGLATLRISELMSPDPATCSPDHSVRVAAEIMRDRRVSCLLVVEAEKLIGILTVRDVTNRVVAEGRDPSTPVRAVMTPNPTSLPPDALGTDVLHEMLERRIGHLPVVVEGRPVGVVTQTDLTRRQALSSGLLIREAVDAPDLDALAAIVGRIPSLLAQLVSAGQRHDVVTRLVTDVGDAVTRRLLAMAEARLGPPPAPYCWLACGSQGRQEQTGVSDQDNCLILDAAAQPEHDAYFAELARFVSSGLDACGYFFCPGDMMATNPQWRQPLSVWERYFAGWIAKPDPKAQMLASVMFDLRPIGGDPALHARLIDGVLERAGKNSIFVAHMISNSLKHTPPLSLFGGMATIRSGEHKDTIDLKHNGVVPVVDLGRVYALIGGIAPVNTRARVAAAAEREIVSASGARDLLDAYDLIADSRLRHQAEQIKAGEKPDNFMAPGTLSDLERSHLRDAFVVIKTMQSALGHGRASAL